MLRRGFVMPAYSLRLNLMSAAEINLGGAASIAKNFL